MIEILLDDAKLNNLTSYKAIILYSYYKGLTKGLKVAISFKYIRSFQKKK